MNHKSSRGKTGNSKTTTNETFINELKRGKMVLGVSLLLGLGWVLMGFLFVSFGGFLGLFGVSCGFFLFGCFFLNTLYSALNTKKEKFTVFNRDSQSEGS